MARPIRGRGNDITSSPRQISDKSQQTTPTLEPPIQEKSKKNTSAYKRNLELAQMGVDAVDKDIEQQTKKIKDQEQRIREARERGGEYWRSTRNRLFNQLDQLVKRRNQLYQERVRARKIFKSVRDDKSFDEVGLPTKKSPKATDKGLKEAQRNQAVRQSLNVSQYVRSTVLLQNLGRPKVRDNLRKAKEKVQRESYVPTQLDVISQNKDVKRAGQREVNRQIGNVRESREVPLSPLLPRVPFTEEGRRQKTFEEQRNIDFNQQIQENTQNEKFRRKKNVEPFDVLTGTVLTTFSVPKQKQENIMQLRRTGTEFTKGLADLVVVPTRGAIKTQKFAYEEVTTVGKTGLDLLSNQKIEDPQVRISKIENRKLARQQLISDPDVQAAGLTVATAPLFFLGPTAQVGLGVAGAGFGGYQLTQAKSPREVGQATGMIIGSAFAVKGGRSQAKANRFLSQTDRNTINIVDADLQAYIGKDFDIMGRPIEGFTKQTTTRARGNTLFESSETVFVLGKQEAVPEVSFSGLEIKSRVRRAGRSTKPRPQAKEFDVQLREQTATMDFEQTRIVPKERVERFLSQETPRQTQIITRDVPLYENIVDADLQFNRREIIDFRTAKSRERSLFRDLDIQEYSSSTDLVPRGIRTNINNPRQKSFIQIETARIKRTGQQFEPSVVYDLEIGTINQADLPRTTKTGTTSKSSARLQDSTYRFRSGADDLTNIQKVNENILGQDNKPLLDSFTENYLGGGGLKAQRTFVFSGLRPSSTKIIRDIATYPTLVATQREFTTFLKEGGTGTRTVTDITAVQRTEGFTEDGFFSFDIVLGRRKSPLTDSFVPKETKKTTKKKKKQDDFIEVGLGDTLTVLERPRTRQKARQTSVSQSSQQSSFQGKRQKTRTRSQEFEQVAKAYVQESTIYTQGTQRRTLRSQRTRFTPIYESLQNNLVSQSQSFTNQKQRPRQRQLPRQDLFLGTNLFFAQKTQTSNIFSNNISKSRTNNLFSLPKTPKSSFNSFSIDFGLEETKKKKKTKRKAAFDFGYTQSVARLGYGKPRRSKNINYALSGIGLR